MAGETRLIDYSYARPTPADVTASGYVGVMRYLSFSEGKNLTKTEAKALHDRKLAIGLVWETTATRATQGAGAEDHAKAEQQAKALGYPDGCPIFYAVDEDVAPVKVLAYFRGAYGAKRTHPVGTYGSKSVCEGVHGAGVTDYMWQTAAWSGGDLSPLAHVYQRIGHEAPPIPGGGYDENVVCNRLPMWGPDGVVHLAPPGDQPGHHDHPGKPTNPTKPATPTHLGPLARRMIGWLTRRLDGIGPGGLDAASNQDLAQLQRAIERTQK
jgi:hypothetical protein